MEGLARATWGANQTIATLNNTCKHCNVTNPQNMCSGCERVAYCSLDCQAKNWPLHKQACLESSSLRYTSGQLDFILWQTTDMLEDITNDHAQARIPSPEVELVFQLARKTKFHTSEQTDDVIVFGSGRNRVTKSEAPALAKALLELYQTYKPALAVTIQPTRMQFFSSMKNTNK